MTKEYILNKKKYSRILICTLMGGIMCANANANYSTYVGVDALCYKMRFKEDFGGNIISKKLAPGLNLFVGHMLNEYFGAEIGFESYKKMKNIKNNIPDGTTVAGVKIDGNRINYWESYSSTVSQRHPYFGLLTKLNITNNYYISVLAGVSLSNIRARYTLFDDEGKHRILEGELVRNFSKTKAIPIVRVSVEHKFNDKVGIRGLLAWKKTSSFTIKSKENPDSKTCLKLKDSFNIGLGVSYYVF